MNVNDERHLGAIYIYIILYIFLYEAQSSEMLRPIIKAKKRFKVLQITTNCTAILSLQHGLASVVKIDRNAAAGIGVVLKKSLPKCSTH